MRIMSQTATSKELLCTFNPFGFRRQSDTQLESYASSEAAYTFCVEMLFAEFPAGFVDIPFFMMKYQQATPSQAWAICPQKQYAYIPWWAETEEEKGIRNARIQLVLQRLLHITGCSIAVEDMNTAINRLDALIDKKNVRETLRKINNIEFLNN